LLLSYFKSGGFALPPPPGWRLNLATHFGVLAARSGGGWGGWLGLLSRRLSPKHKEYSFLPLSPYLHDFSLMFLMLYSPLDTGLLLVLLQPSGYFWLCSSKSSFRGTVAIFKAKPKNF
jgi:hypothetical protein